MKKVIAAILLGVAAIWLTACANASADDELPLELKLGRYYLDGDVNADVYVDVTEDYITMGGDGLYDYWYNDHLEYAENATPESADEVANLALEHRTVPCEYNYVDIDWGDGSTKYFIVFNIEHDPDWNPNATSGAIYYYNDVGVISPSHGEFICVE